MIGVRILKREDAPIPVTYLDQEDHEKPLMKKIKKWLDNSF
jgi:hypothetical protein